MNQKKAKQLRRMAREEMLEDPEYDLVSGPRSERTAVNSPNSKRGMYIKLKRAYGEALEQGFFSRKI